MHETYSILIKLINKNYKKTTLCKNYQNFLIAISPVIPHFSNECLNSLNMNNDICHFLLKKTFINNWPFIVVQVNGKKRGLVVVKKEINENELLEILKKDEALKKHIDDKLIKRQIYVKNKLINIII